MRDACKSIYYIFQHAPRYSNGENYSNSTLVPLKIYFASLFKQLRLTRVSVYFTEEEEPSFLQCANTAPQMTFMSACRTSWVTQATGYCCMLLVWMGGASGQSCLWGHPDDSLPADPLCDCWAGVTLLEREFVPAAPLPEQVPGTGRRMQISRHFSMVLPRPPY